MSAVQQRPIRTATIVGARPQFVKLAPVSRAMRHAPVPIDDQLIHTGQHYDDAMSKVFFEELDLPEPGVNLGVGSGPHGQQTARILEAAEETLQRRRPDVVLVYGDTNSTLAGALAAAKLHIPVAHVEAGLRSFNRRMPEELNRILTDHLSQLLFAPTATSVANLAAEGLQSRVVRTGDVMYDAVLFNARRARTQSSAVQRLAIEPGAYGVATIHRAENTTAADLRVLLQALNEAAMRFCPILLPLHPRTAGVLQSDLPDWRPAAALQIIAPVAYLDMLALLQQARFVLTDSGGLQKEAFFLKCPCVTLRDETEWVETLQGGANTIAGRHASGLISALEELMRRPRRPFEDPAAAGDDPLGAGDRPFGAGDAAQRIVAAICEFSESTR